MLYKSIQNNKTTFFLLHKPAEGHHRGVYYKYFLLETTCNNLWINIKNKTKKIFNMLFDPFMFEFELILENATIEKRRSICKKKHM